MWSDTVKRLLDEAAPATDRFLVLIAPALDRAQVERDWRDGRWPWRWLRRRPKEFVARYAHLGWDIYLDRIARPVLEQMRLIRDTTRATILPNVNFTQFVSALRDDRFDAILLFAHHFGDRSQGTPVFEGVEFADGARPWPEVKDAIARQLTPSSSSSPDRRRALILMVCEGTPWAIDLRGQVEPLAVGAVSVKVSLMGAAVLGREWIRQCDGQRTLSDALDAATRVLFAEPPQDSEDTHAGRSA